MPIQSNFRWMYAGDASENGQDTRQDAAQSAPTPAHDAGEAAHLGAGDFEAAQYLVGQFAIGDGGDVLLQQLQLLLVT